MTQRELTKIKAEACREFNQIIRKIIDRNDSQNKPIMKEMIRCKREKDFNGLRQAKKMIVKLSIKEKTLIANQIERKYLTRIKHIVLE